MKRCTKCGKEKSLNEFSFKIKTLGLRQYQCIKCSRILIRDHYNRNRGYYLEKAKKRNTKIRTEARAFIKEYLLKHPCVDCGESDIIVLEFDHRNSKLKLTEISQLIRAMSSLDAIKKEINKCDVRCANCHRRKTARDFGWFKNSI